MRLARPGVVCLAVLLVLAEACTQVEVRRSAPPPRPRLPHSGEPPTSDHESLAVSHLLELLNTNREARGADHLSVDRGLALVAQAAGKEYQRLGRGFEQRVAARANSDLRSFSLVFVRVAALVVFVERLEQAAAVLGPAMDPEMRFVGISVANSPPPMRQKGGYAVVLTLGR